MNEKTRRICVKSKLSIDKKRIVAIVKKRETTCFPEPNEQEMKNLLAYKKIYSH